MKRRLIYGGLALGIGLVPSQAETNPQTKIDKKEIAEVLSPKIDSSEYTKKMVIKQIGKTSLEVTNMQPEIQDNIFPNSLVVELKNQEDCAVEYYFSEDEMGNEVVSVGIFGKPSDMTNPSKINGPEMFDGTYGHGETDGVGDSDIPTSTLAPDYRTSTTIVEYMEEKTKNVCRIFEQHINDPESGYPG